MNPSNDFETFVPPPGYMPEDYESARDYLTEVIEDLTDGVNVRDYAFYVEQEIINGQQWLGGSSTPERLRPVFRKVVNLGGLPNFGSTDPKTVAHGITTSANTCITRLYGTASDPGASTLTSGIPLPYVDAGGTAHIGLSMDATNIIISGDATTDYSAYTCAFAVIEWIDEA